MSDRLLRMALQKLGTGALSLEAFVTTFSKVTLNPELYFELAKERLHSGNAARAHAEVKTAQILGLQKMHIREFMFEFKVRLQKFKSISHSEYFMYEMLKTEQ